jgi:hypothetical protein
MKPEYVRWDRILRDCLTVQSRPSDPAVPELPQRLVDAEREPRFNRGRRGPNEREAREECAA